MPTKTSLQVQAGEIDSDGSIRVVSEHSSIPRVSPELDSQTNSFVKEITFFVFLKTNFPRTKQKNHDFTERLSTQKEIVILFC